MNDYKVEDVIHDLDHLYELTKNISNKYNCDINVICKRNTYMKKGVDISVLESLDILIMDSDGTEYKHVPKKKRGI